MQHRYDGVVAEVEHDGLTADFSVGLVASHRVLRDLMKGPR